jgi:hypothetical protein
MTTPTLADPSAPQDPSALPGTESGPPLAPPGGRERSRWWNLPAAIAIVAGLLLAPVAVVISYAKAQVDSTERFVETFGPLAQNAGVQDLIVTETMRAIEENVDLTSISDDLLADLSGSGVPPRLQSAIEKVQAPLAEGLRSAVESAVTKLVQSEEFNAIWVAALTASHNQLQAVLSGQDTAALDVGEGQISLNVGGIVDKLKAALVAKGYTILGDLPQVQKTVPLVSSDQLAIAQRAYGALGAIGFWLPWIVAALLLAGVLLARRPPVAAVVTGLALGGAMLLLGAGVAIGERIFRASMSPEYMSSAAADSIYATVVAFARDLTQFVGVLAVTLSIVFWLLGPFAVPRRLRRGIGRAGASLRSDTGTFGVVLYRFRGPVLVLTGLIAAGVVVMTYPSWVAVVVTAAVALLVAGVVALLAHPAARAPAESTERGTLTAGVNG